MTSHAFTNVALTLLLAATSFIVGGLAIASQGVAETSLGFVIVLLALVIARGPQVYG